MVQLAEYIDGLPNICGAESLIDEAIRNRRDSRSYDDILIPMERASSEFHQRVLARDVPSTDPGYRNALFHLLASETSCYRYWGEGIWTAYGAELPRRTTDIVTRDL